MSFRVHKSVNLKAPHWTDVSDVVSVRMCPEICEIVKNDCHKCPLHEDCPMLVVVCAPMRQYMFQVNEFRRIMSRRPRIAEGVEDY